MKEKQSNVEISKSGNIGKVEPINIVDEYNEDINDISMSSKPIKPKKIQFNDIVKVRVFG